ncbi:MAG TPA: alpha/beta hydrolase [Caulobacteraceae bacterium]|jgi:pimeloyl-ACP methyl ester carboxylesterase|nr:alpha/beta hydrolase [Caulobacteraceae bacterium]
MPFTTDAGPAIYYETLGDPSRPPIVLISGASAQLIWWRDEFIQRLIDRGLYIVRFDNRDVGLSAKIGGPQDVAPAYGVADMAGDVCRVLDALDIASAHIVGQSLGGIIAQSAAINHPDRIRSMVIFYTLPAFELRYVAPWLLETVTSAGAPPEAGPTPSREQTIEEFLQRERNCRSTAYEFDEAWMRDYVTRCVDRGYCPGGIARQAAAAMSIGDFGPQLQKLSLPAAIIHGRADRMLQCEAGFDLGRLIPESELHIYPGMGHEFPRPLWDEFADIIARTTRRADAPARVTAA